MAIMIDSSISRRIYCIDKCNTILYVVHIEFEGEAIRIISARKANREEIKDHDS